MTNYAEAEIDFDDPVRENRRKVWKKVFSKMRRIRSGRGKVGPSGEVGGDQAITKANVMQGCAPQEAIDNLEEDNSVVGNIGIALEQTKSGLNRMMAKTDSCSANHSELVEAAILEISRCHTEDRPTQEEGKDQAQDDDNNISDVVLTTLVEETKRLSQSALEATKKTTSEFNQSMADLEKMVTDQTSSLPKKLMHASSWFNKQKLPAQGMLLQCADHGQILAQDETQTPQPKVSQNGTDHASRSSPRQLLRPLQLFASYAKQHFVEHIESRPLSSNPTPTSVIPEYL